MKSKDADNSKPLPKSAPSDKKKPWAAAHRAKIKGGKKN